jgi:hypothetical protein
MDAAGKELSMSTARPSVGEDRLAKGLGWFSLGLGVPQLLAPQQVNRLIGVAGTRRNQVIMRAVGLRELGGAVGLLGRPRPAGFLFARVAGDAMDLLLLRAALRAEGNARHRVAAVAAAVAGVTVLDMIASAKTSRSSQRLLVAVFRGLAGLRHARAFHPRGLMFAGELTTEEESPLPLDAGVRPVIARLSKGVGTPGGAPDILGLAVRIPTENGLSRSWDLALSSSGSGTLSRMVPIPARRWGAARYGSIVPYRHGDRRMWLLAVPEDSEPSEPASLERLERWVGDRSLRFIVHTGLDGEGWRETARLTLHTVLPGTEVNRVAFDPMTNHPPGLRMSPRWLSRMREWAYQGSRAGRASADPSSSATG